MDGFVISITALTVLSIASLQDLKTREVLDWLTIGLIFFAFFIRLNYTLLSGDTTIIINGFYGFIIATLIAYFMFYTGQWGGGDSKLLMGMGILIGHSSFLYAFIISIFLVGSIYGVFYSLFLAIKHKRKFIKELSDLFKKYKKIHRIILFSSLIIIFSLIFTSRIVRLYFSMIVVMSLLVFYLYIFTKAVEKGCMIKKYNPMKLTEGDWIVEDIKYKGKYLAGPKDLGIDKKQIDKIQKLYKENKIKSVLVKEGIPFVPSFLFAYILVHFYGNLFYLFL